MAKKGVLNTAKYGFKPAERGRIAASKFGFAPAEGGGGESKHAKYGRAAAKGAKKSDHPPAGTRSKSRAGPKIGRARSQTRRRHK